MKIKNIGHIVLTVAVLNKIIILSNTYFVIL